VLKGLLHTAGMNVSFSGGLSSYSLFLMVCVAYEGIVQHFAATKQTQQASQLLAKQTADSLVGDRQNNSPLNSPLSPTNSGNGNNTNTNANTNANNSTNENALSLGSVSVLTINNNRENNKQSSTFGTGTGSNINEGMLFLHFLQYYSRVFEPSTMGLGEF
jgi:hypothetical protein